MRILIQRVSHAKVVTDGQTIGKIGKGILALVGFEETDDKEDFEWIIKKMTQLRIFPDENGVMNISVSDIKGEILVVSQFTLHAMVKKGNRPSYIRSSPPEAAKQQYDDFVSLLKKMYISTIETGKFGADMKVELLNDGPVTIFIDSKNREL